MAYLRQWVDENIYHRLSEMQNLLKLFGNNFKKFMRKTLLLIGICW